MKKTCSATTEPTPQLTLCAAGCVHLHIGPATITMSAAGLRSLVEIAQKALATLPPGAPTQAIVDRSVH